MSAIDRTSIANALRGSDIPITGEISRGPLFLKTGSAGALDLFEAEACGLNEFAY
jgi:hypothetical protein